MKKNKKFDLKEEYKKSWDYIKKSQKYIWIVVVFFFFTAIIGFFIQPPQEIIDKILELIKDLLEKTSSLSQLGLIRFIILNNLKVSLIGIASGFFFGILPIIFTVSNGYLLGFVAKMSVEQAGLNTLLNLLPHGIFELPAVFISLGLGLKFGTFVFHKNWKKTFEEYLINSLKVFVFIVLPLLIIAGIIEGTLIFISK